MSTKNYDLIVYGASSFVGAIMSHYLAEHLAGSPQISWAIAGRSHSALPLPPHPGEGAQMHLATMWIEKSERVLISLGLGWFIWLPWDLNWNRF